MKRWVDIIGYEPIEETKIVEPNQQTLHCCNCNNLIKVVNIWSKCEHCNFYNAK
jgi:hypothetical protein